MLINFLTGNSTASKLLRLAVVIEVTFLTARSTRGYALASVTLQNLFGLSIGCQWTRLHLSAALLVRLLVPTSPPLSATAPRTASWLVLPSSSITISPPSPSTSAPSFHSSALSSPSQPCRLHQRALRSAWSTDRGSSCGRCVIPCLVRRQEPDRHRFVLTPPSHSH